MAGTSTKVVLKAMIPRLALLAALGGSLAAIWLELPADNIWSAIFYTVFVLRYLRLFGNLIGHVIYRPSPVRADQAFDGRDVSVILPTVDPNGPDFKECLSSVLTSGVASIFVVTVGAQLKDECKQAIRCLAHLADNTSVYVSAINEANKRKQVASVMPQIKTSITILLDDHVFWPHKNFIPSVIAPFENPNVVAVATKKRVRRTTPGEFSFMSILNFIACNYLERHNYELRSSNAIDGGVFVVSGRTAVYRTDFLADEALLRDFCNEKFFFGLFGDTGLTSGNDNFLSRRVIENGGLIRFQDTEDATIETTLGEWPKFNGQLLRWSRSTIVGNPALLKNPTFLYRYTWSACMVYLASLLNFAIVWDTALLFTFVRSMQTSNDSTAWVALIVAWLMLTKTIKIVPALIRHPSDCSLVIFQIIFGYIHSFYKLWSVITFWDCEWSGRKLDEVNVEPKDSNLGEFDRVV